MPFKTLRLAFAVSAFGLLSACTLDDDDDKKTFITDSAAVISTVAPDYSGSDIQVVDLASGDYNVSSGLQANDQSDMTVDGGEQAFYHIGKNNIDTISRYSIDDTAVAKYTYSTKVNAEDASANPYTIVEYSITKAFLVRYASDKVWVVNPTAETEAEFKIGEIDLSAYNDGGNDPEAFGAVIVGNKLFVGMQRLNGWARVRNGTVAVFDVNTLTEIDTASNSTTKGIDLGSINPIKMTVNQSVGIVVASIDAYNDGASFESAIEKINPASYAVSVLVDDGTDADSNLYGAFSNVAILDANNAYFVAYAGWKDNNLYHFNPTSGAVTGIVENFDGVNISALATDNNKQAWVGIGDAANPRIHVLAADQTGVAEISLIQNPNAIAFSTKTVTQ